MSLLPVFSNGAILLKSQAIWNKLSPQQREIIVSSVPDAPWHWCIWQCRLDLPCTSLSNPADL